MATRNGVDENAHYFQEDDWVKLRHRDVRKFEPVWKGPYIIHARHHPHTYLLKTPRGDLYHSPVNESELAPWISTTTNQQHLFYDGTRRSNLDSHRRREGDNVSPRG